MKLWRLAHYNVETTKPSETIRFYTDCLGLENAPHKRPSFATAGTWMFLGDQPVVHINYVESVRSDNTGPINHVAFEGQGYAAFCRRFKDLGVQFEVLESPDIDMAQIFVIDPNGVRVEITIRGEGVGRSSNS
jgi:catechol 2,3-dioxygenase-like lactoylglutathione lyase family enzyme